MPVFHLPMRALQVCSSPGFHRHWIDIANFGRPFMLFSIDVIGVVPHLLVMFKRSSLWFSQETK
jgi:hypothetical protein